MWMYMYIRVSLHYAEMGGRSTKMGWRERELKEGGRSVGVLSLFCTSVLGARRVRANEVYQEYIKDKNHYHMNATRVCQHYMLSACYIQCTYVDVCVC